MKIKSILLLFTFPLFYLTAWGQSSTQTLRGTILDVDSKSPIIGATVQIMDANQIIGAVTDLNGDFKIPHVSLGRCNILVRSTGYEEQVVPNILLTAAKEVILNISMVESIENLEAVVVTATNKRGEVLNEMALISARSFSVEETLRYAGSFNDPARMVSAFAGVSANAEGDNDIVVRGNSPKGILWRLEGVEIPNPNHFADEGSTGGPVNALNSNMLDNSDFYTGAFAPEFGNALSGVFDIRFKKGNNETNEYTASAGVLGIDFTAEGPFKEGYRGSYIANYRYSSLQLLDEFGLVDFGGVPKYQDVSFNVNLPIKENQQLSIFGLGGISSILGEESFENGDPAYRGIFDSDLGVLGISHLYFFGEKASVKNTISLSGTRLRAQDEYTDDQGEFYETIGSQIDKSTIRTLSSINYKWNSKNKTEAGLIFSFYGYNLNAEEYSAEARALQSVLSDKGSATGIQGFISWKHRFNEQVTMTSGLHSTYFDFNQSYTIEPRVGFKWDIAKKHSLNAGFGIHSKLGNISTYLAKVPNENSFTQPNLTLSLPKAAHYVLGYDYQINANTHFKSEIYYQQLYDIPIEGSKTSSYSLINDTDTYVNTALVNEGIGRNYGLEFTLERFFNRGFYYMSTLSIYNSLYTAGDGIERSTAYNGNYIFNMIGGKEFAYGKSGKDKVFFINTKISLLGGTPYTPIDLEASKNMETTVFENRPYSLRGDDVFFANLSFGTRKNKRNTTREFKIDFNNVTNHSAVVRTYYNQATEEVEKSTQLPMIPNIIYTIKF